jgi:hypothetical protein
LRETEAPAELARIVSQAMAKSPNDRPSRIPDLSAQIVRFRRQFQAETRRLTVQAGAKYTAVVDLATSVRRAATRLELEASIEVDTVVHDLQARFPHDRRTWRRGIRDDVARSRPRGAAPERDRRRAETARERAAEPAAARGDDDAR